MNNKQKKTLNLLSSFAIPAFLMLIILIMGGFYPFGERSVLVADMRYQFVDYIGYMKQMVFGNDDIFYSFSKTFGGDMTGFIAYYLSNPFFLMLLAFPNDMLPMGIVFMIVLMCGGCGLTFYLMLREVYGERFAEIFFSTSYALMGYYVAYVNCIHYFFSVMMLPLVILGLYRTVRRRKISILYVFSIAAAVISCYYIGYMILIFTAVFYLYLLATDEDCGKSAKDIIRLSVTVLTTTLLGVGISAFSLCATVMSLQGQKSSGILMSLSSNFSLWRLPSGLFTGSFYGNISDGLPIIYCGVATVIFLLMFLLNNSISIKERLLTVAFFAFLAAGFWIDMLNVAWHGFAHPIGFPYRNSFLFSFLAIFIGFKGLVVIRDGIKKIHYAIIYVIMLAYSGVLFFFAKDITTVEQLSVTMLFATLMLVCIFMIQYKRIYLYPALIGLFVLQLGDLTYNGVKSVNAYFHDSYMEDDETSMAEYVDYIDETKDLVDYVQSQDDSFYRMDKLFRRTHNDPMMFGYNGLSHFSSCETNQVKRFMGKLGYRDNGNWAFYGCGNTSFADSFMGIKYMLSQYDETSKFMDRIYMNDNYKYIYKNRYPLALGMGMSSKYVRSVDMNSGNPFELQNEMASSYSDTSYKIYRPVDVSVKLDNVTKDGTIYKKTDNTKDAYVEFDLHVNSTDFIFGYFNAPKEQACKLIIEEYEKWNYFSEYEWEVKEIGYFKPGDRISVKLRLDEDEVQIDDYYFYYENENVMKEWYKDASSTKCDINKVKSSHLIADADVSEDTDILVFSIPYEEDWAVTLDGKKVKTKRAFDSLLSLDVTPGKHTVEMRYIPRGLMVGMPITLASLIATFCIILISKRRETTMD